VRQSHSMAKRWDAVIAEIGNDSAAGRQSPMWPLSREV
jgi:hypothetical protein